MLKKGQRFKVGRDNWRVVLVNQSRALCYVERKETISMVSKNGVRRTFKVTRRVEANISPDTPLGLLAEMVGVVNEDR